MIDRNTAEKIKDTANIVEVVSDYVHLTRRGANYMGLCPFHNERTPSFSVNPRKNFCYCFSCHKGGSPINFIMEKEGINYHDALLYLAKKYGITVEERELTDEERRQQSLREGMFVANEWAMQKMVADLTDTDEGRNIGGAYFHERGVTPEALKVFRLGYALDRPNSLSEAAKRVGVDIDILKAVGLVGTSQQGNLYDRFRGRVIFPILNSSGKVVAFGGRDLKGGPAKYVNSPESEIYHKNRELYGMYQAKNEIVRQDKCFLVEGYMDVIGMWQSGLQNVVASSGTALTDGQIALIHRFTENITLLYDGDAAGVKAALRGIDMLLSHKMKVKVLLLPDGHDPDSFARKNTPEEFRKYVEEHETDIIRFKAQVMMQDAGSDPLKRSDAVRSVVKSLACVPDPITANVYVQECARLMNVDESIIAAETSRIRIEMLEKMRTERRQQRDRDRINQAAQKNSSVLSTQPITTGFSKPSPPEIKPTESKSPQNLLYPFERQIASYCVRFGAMDFCEVEDENGEIFWFSVADYILWDLEEYQMQFSTPEFQQVINAATALRSHFLEDRDRYRNQLNQSAQAMREQGIAEIREKNLDIQSIQREEELLEQRITHHLEEEETQWAAAYTGKVLASSEEDFVRQFANECLADQKPLSRRFSIQGTQMEHDRLVELIPRALFEWRQGLIRQKMENLRREIAKSDSEGDSQALHQAMMEITQLQKIERELAKNIGDRVVSPRR